MTSVAASDRVHPFGTPWVQQEQTHALKEDALETKIFICYNALSETLASRELQELCAIAGTPGEPLTRTSPTDRGQGSGARGGLNRTEQTPVASPQGEERSGGGTRATVEKIPCLGKVDPRYLLKAFEAGCDAVCLIGCAIGKCRTMDGNLRAEKRVILLRGLLEEIGLKGERLFLFLREPMSKEAAREVIVQFLAEAHAFGRSELKDRSAVDAEDRMT